MGRYAPSTFRALTYHDAAPRFAGGEDSPRAYLERCLETIAEREAVVQAWVVLNEAGACGAADASTERWRAGRPLSPIDGMPMGIQVMAQPHMDAQAAAIARWMLETIEPVEA